MFKYFLLTIFRLKSDRMMEAKIFCSKCIKIWFFRWSRKMGHHSRELNSDYIFIAQTGHILTLDRLLSFMCARSRSQWSIFITYLYRFIWYKYTNNERVFIASPSHYSASSNVALMASFGHFLRLQGGLWCSRLRKPVRGWSRHSVLEVQSLWVGLGGCLPDQNT